MDGHLARFKLRDVQHVLHQPCQAPCLLRDDAQIVLCLLRRDRAVQHAVNEALDRRHRRAQLVGNVAHELPAGVVDGLQPRRHIIKGGGEIRKLDAAVHRRAGGEITAAQPPRGLADVLDRPRDAPRQHPAQDAAQNQDDRRRDAEHCQHIGHVAAQRGHGAGGKQIAVLPADRDAPPGCVIFVVVDAVQRTGGEDVPPLVQFGYVLFRHARAGEGVVAGVQQNVAVAVRDEDQRAGRRVEQLEPAVGFFHNVVALQGLRHDGALVGEPLAQGGRAVEHIGQRAFAFADEIRRRQRGLDGAHDAEPQHQHRRDRAEKFTADRVAAAHSLTSNL